MILKNQTKVTLCYRRKCEFMRFLSQFFKKTRKSLQTKNQRARLNKQLVNHQKNSKRESEKGEKGGHIAKVRASTK